MAEAADSARSSYYVDDAYYRDLVAHFTDWRREERLNRDAAPREACGALLLREARLLDEGRFEDWLALFAPQCLYWVPGTPAGGDPRSEVALCFDDRRQLEGRIYRLRTGYAWSQVPGSRTSRVVSNIEVFASDAPAAWMIRSNLLISEFRAGETRLLAGWCAHRIAQLDQGWRILVKQVNLLDCDQPLRNPSLIL